MCTSSTYYTFATDSLIKQFFTRRLILTSLKYQAQKKSRMWMWIVLNVSLIRTIQILSEVSVIFRIHWTWVLSLVFFSCVSTSIEYHIPFLMLLRAVRMTEAFPCKWNEVETMLNVTAHNDMQLNGRRQWWRDGVRKRFTQSTKQEQTSNSSSQK